MLHYFITNRAINKDDQGEFINEDGGESAGENMRCGTFDTAKYKTDKKSRNALTLFSDAPNVKRNEPTNQPLTASYTKEAVSADTTTLLGSERLFAELYNSASRERCPKPWFVSSRNKSIK